MRYILCLDQATISMGWALCAIKGNNLKPLKWGIHKSRATLDNGGRYFEKMNFIRSIIKQLAKNNIKISYVVLEEVPMHNDKPKVRDVLNQLLGCIKMALYLDKIPMEELNPNHWKPRSGIRSKDRVSQKKEGIVRVKQLFDIDVESDDVSDCICMGISAVRDGLYFKIIEGEKLEDTKKNKKKRGTENTKLS